LNEWVLRHALSPRAEPLPEYGREGMEAIRGFYRKLVDDEGKVQFHANHPSKYSFFCFKIVPCLVLESIFHLTRFDFKACFKRQPIGTFLLIDRFHFSLRFYGSGFEPFSILFFHCELWIRIRTVFQIGVSFKSLFVNIFMSAYILNHIY
jgi:hypothetical protein